MKTNNNSTNYSQYSSEPNEINCTKQKAGRVAIGRNSTAT